MSQNDFRPLFDQWAAHYDQTVHDSTGEYHEVFEGYEQILTEIVQQIPKQARNVLEIGVGTGNLASKIIEKGFSMIGVEPSEQMRKEVEKKGLALELREGDFLHLPLAEDEKVDVVVSSYAFHHLTLVEKKESIRLLKSVLTQQGKIIFADTSYENEQAKQELLERVKTQRKWNLWNDLQTEFYELMGDLKPAFEQQGFRVEVKQLNRFVWLLVAA